MINKEANIHIRVRHKDGKRHARLNKTQKKTILISKQFMTQSTTDGFTVRTDKLRFLIPRHY